MSQNNNSNKKQIDIPSPEEEDYIPKILDLRLKRRKSAKYFSIYFFVIIAFYIIFGIIFFCTTYVTRYFIYDPDLFWAINMENPNLLKLQRFSASAGMFLVCSSIFAIMDNIVIYYHIIKGGLKRRLQYANYIFFFIQVFSFIFCLYGICAYRNLIVIFPIIFSYSSFALISSIIYFIIIKRSLNVENLFLLSIERMILHQKNLKDQYSSKKIKKEL